jgi:hypothetical protein
VQKINYSNLLASPDKLHSPQSTYSVNTVVPSVDIAAREQLSNSTDQHHRIALTALAEAATWFDTKFATHLAVDILSARRLDRRITAVATSPVPLTML